MRGSFLAVDWGTTNRRVYRIDATGTVEHSERDAQGVRAVAQGGFAREAQAIRERFGDLPMLCAGMVGSNIGWTDAGYLPCPARIADLAGNVRWVESERTAIVPGVHRIEGRRADVMRGEEVQLLGAVAAGLAPRGGLLCQPGTHCKWARMRDGALADFATAMTGELFSLLKEHSLLSAQLGDPVGPGDAFLEGVKDGAQGDLQARLFGARAAMLLGVRDHPDHASYVSGLLIGNDVAQQVAPGETVHILADAALGALYRAAIEAQGGAVMPVDSHAAFVAGIVEIARTM